MKNIFYSLSGLIGLTLFAVACQKDVSNRTTNLPALQAGNIDLNAGNWKTVLLSRPDSFSVIAPVATSSPLYTADLFEIKALQKNLTGDQANTIKYWAAGGVLRWNEIIRGLVAKYNLPPVQNADGSYPIPNANNPLAYPLFPFSNPPYAARAFGYIAAAQYDALVACWYYKTKYNRAAPYKFDSSVAAKFINRSDLPSYPSEAAVLAGVTAEMMKLLFPGRNCQYTGESDRAGTGNYYEWSGYAFRCNGRRSFGPAGCGIIYNTCQGRQRGQSSRYIDRLDKFRNHSNQSGTYTMV